MILDAREELDDLQDLDTKLIGVEDLQWWPRTHDGKAIAAAFSKD